jgi:hypothetical protein
MCCRNAEQAVMLQSFESAACKLLSASSVYLLPCGVCCAAQCCHGGASLVEMCEARVRISVETRTASLKLRICGRWHWHTRGRDATQRFTSLIVRTSHCVFCNVLAAKIDRGCLPPVEVLPRKTSNTFGHHSCRRCRVAYLLCSLGM